MSEFAVGISGSRSLEDVSPVLVAFDRALGRLAMRLCDERRFDLCKARYIHGGASGVDTIIGTWLEKDTTAHVEVLYPDWSQGKAAAFIRNQAIVDRSDALVAIWDGQSRGTRHTIARAAARGIPVVVEVLS